MPRIIVFLLTVAALAIVALQNLATEVPLIIFGKTFASAMPFGLLLVITVGIGALLTLIFYGLLGSRRPPESKYRPMGRRMPYPESPSSNPLPASKPAVDSSYGDSSQGYSRSSAFVSEPETAQPFVTPPENPPIQDTPPASSPDTPSSDPSSNGPSAYGPSAYEARPYKSDAYESRSYESGTYGSGTYGSDTYEAGAYESSREPRSEGSMRSDSIPNKASAGAAANAFVQQPIAGLKSVFGKKKDRKDKSDESDRPIGDDWGQRRTKEQINDWDTSVGEPSRLEEGAKSLFNLGRNVGANAGRLAEDIASGWNNPAADGRSDVRNDGPVDGRYADNRYDGLDQGWENFDDYVEPPLPREGAGDGARERTGEGYEKRTYGDSLYGDADSLDGDYPDEAYADDIGPDGVYDADYKVIVPPSKPLTDSDDRPDDYA